MKKIPIIVMFFILAISSFTFAQSPPADFDRVRQIKPLESTREDVRRILTGFKSNIDEKNFEDGKLIHSEVFSTKSVDIEISYSIGNCSDNSNEWNVPKGKVTLIEISLNNLVKVEDSEFDFSRFRKEQHFVNNDDLFIYHDKNIGLAFEVYKERIEKIFLFPTNSYYSWLCENEEAQEYEQLYSTDSWFGNTKLEDRVQVTSCSYLSLASVRDLSLSEYEISKDCYDSTEGKNCSEKEMKVSVVTTSLEPEGIVLTYLYTVSGGKIIGEGANVVWDLSRVKTGTYTITAAVDDGRGVLGMTKTKTVTVR